VDDDGGGGVGGGRCRRSGHRSCDKHRRDDEAGIGVGDGAIGSKRREHPRGDGKMGRNGCFDGSGRREMRVIGGGDSTQGSKEGGGWWERSGRGGEGEAAAVDANSQGQDGDTANGEKIRTAAKEKEKEKKKEKERATHDVDTVAVMVSQQWKEEGRGGRGGIADCCHRRRRTKRRRKANKGAQAAVTKMTATVEEDEAKTIAAIDVGCMNNGADDPTTALRCLRTARRCLGATLTRRASKAMCTERHCIVVLLIC